MPPRVPLDVDLEDRLIYGLTPTRLAYLVVAMVSGFAVWSSPWAPAAVRALAALLIIGLGAVASWGRWRGRAADLWLVDIALFSIRTRQVTWNTSWLRFPRRKTSRKPSPTRAAENLPALT